MQQSPADIEGSTITKGGNTIVNLIMLGTVIDKGFEDAKQVIAALKDKGISAIGAAGFCWGGKLFNFLFKTFKLQCLLHLSFVSVDDFKEVEAPIAILGAEIEHLSPPELVKQFEEILSSKPEADSLVKIYLGVAHGWTVRYNVEDKKAVQSAQEAHQDMLNFFVCV
ncbi:endo-1,3;1,4-beta-D-glucanase-like [Solanum verrucosum]|uniref:endo-1,3;1,4-beta-D-glucanase-like n=1 Tax=Solanum verrucosum TaxID=315347 RepID=UPI0020D0F898|nr:endo-1,3;1,4-beta-D-glucanase-like [Solanum verrucosum]